MVVQKNISQKDSISKIRKITPDYFKIDENAFEKFTSGKFSNWFKDEESNAKLYFVPYTDYSITTTILTNDKIPTKDYESLLEGEKIKFKENNFIKIKKPISAKGIYLGIRKSEVIKIFENPDSQTSDKNSENLKWNFKMVESKNDFSGNLQPFVHNDLDFNVEMIFKNNQLSTLIYSYEVP